MVGCLIPSGRAEEEAEFVPQLYGGVSTSDQLLLYTDTQLNYIKGVLLKLNPEHYFLLSRPVSAIGGSALPDFVQYDLVCISDGIEFYTRDTANNGIRFFFRPVKIDALVDVYRFYFYDNDSFWTSGSSLSSDWGYIEHIQYEKFELEYIKSFSSAVGTVYAVHTFKGEAAYQRTNYYRGIWSDLWIFPDLRGGEEVNYDHAQAVILASFVLFGVFRSLRRSLRGRDS